MDSQQDSPDGSDSVTLYDGQGFPVEADKAADEESVERKYDEKGFLIAPQGVVEAQVSATSGTSDAEAVAASASSANPTLSRSTSEPENAASRHEGIGTTVGVVFTLLAGLLLL